MFGQCFPVITFLGWAWKLPGGRVILWVICRDTHCGWVPEPCSHLKGGLILSHKALFSGGRSPRPQGLTWHQGRRLEGELMTCLGDLVTPLLHLGNGSSDRGFSLFGLEPHPSSQASPSGGLHPGSPGQVSHTASPPPPTPATHFSVCGSPALSLPHLGKLDSGTL